MRIVCNCITSLRKQLTFCDVTGGFLVKWCLRNECRNSRNTSSVFQTSFCWGTSGDVAKCWLFSQATVVLVKWIFYHSCVILEAIGANTCALLNCKNYWKPPHQEVSKHWTWVISEHGIGMLIDCPALPSLVLACISSKPLFSLVLVASIVGSLIGSGTYKLLLQWWHQGQPVSPFCQTLRQRFFFCLSNIVIKKSLLEESGLGGKWNGKRLIYAAIFTS